jgi:hypothetical protein
MKQKRDYLKYWRLARRYVKVKYNLKFADLEMLLFLYTEGYFDKRLFHEYKQVFPWEKNKMERLISEGWITIFRKKKPGTREIYELSFKAKAIISNLYDICEGKTITMDARYNKMFRGDASFTDKVFRNAIKKRNKIIRQQQHPSRKL